MSYKKSNPNGQATAANSEPVVIASDQSALPISVAALPLPTGAATEAGNLATIKTNTDKIPVQGQALAAASTPVVLTAIQQAALTPPSAIVGFNLEATQLLVKAKTDNIPAQGQALAAASLPVVLTAAQIITLTPPAAISGFALAANQQTNAITDVQIRATALPVSIAAVVPVSGSFFQATQPVSGSFFQATQPVSGSFFQATQPVSGPATDAQLRLTPLPVTMSNTLALTDTQLRAAPVPISLATAPTTPVTGTFFPATQPVSGTFFQATQPVSGPLTDTQIRASAIQVAGTRPNSGASAVGGSSHLTVGGSDGTNLRPILLDVTGKFVPTPEGVVSIVNSTIVNLAANAVFTGTAEDITLYANIKTTIYSSHASATNGLTFQQSHDGVLWIPLTDAYTIPALVQRPFSIPPNMRFYRVVYTNGATATTTIVLQTIYHKSDKQPSSVRPQDARSNENDFVEMLSYLMGYNSALDSWDRLRSTTAKGLDVNPTELRAATLVVSVTAASGVAATLTIPAVAAQFHYITGLTIQIYATAARVGAAAPVVVTTTNIQGSPAYTFETAQAIGTNTPVQGLTNGVLKSAVVNTATTIVAPLVTGGIWRITATYFTAA